MICERCFSKCEWLASVTFDRDRKVLRFDFSAFSSSGLTSIQIPSSIEVVCEGCFSQCALFASGTFDADRKVSRFNRYAFPFSGLTSIHILSSVEVIDKDCFRAYKSLISVTRDPRSKLRTTLSGLLTGVCILIAIDNDSFREFRKLRRQRHSIQQKTACEVRYSRLESFYFRVNARDRRPCLWDCHSEQHRQSERLSRRSELKRRTAEQLHMGRGTNSRLSLLPSSAHDKSGAATFAEPLFKSATVKLTGL
jgi:hypothetical protein